MWRTNSDSVLVRHLSLSVWTYHLITCSLQSVLAQGLEQRSVHIPFVFQGGDLLALESKRDEVQEILNRTRNLRVTTSPPDLNLVIVSTKRHTPVATVRRPTTAMPEFFPVDDDREAASNNRNSRLTYNTLPSPSITRDISLDTSYSPDTVKPPPRAPKKGKSIKEDDTFDNWQTAASGYGGQGDYNSYGGSSYGSGGGYGGYSGGSYSRDSYSKEKDYPSSSFYADKPSYQSQGYGGWGGGGDYGSGNDNTLALILALKLRKERERYEEDIAARDYYIASNSQNYGGGGGSKSSGGGSSGLLGILGIGLGALGALGGGGLGSLG